MEKLTREQLNYVEKKFNEIANEKKDYVDKELNFLQEEERRLIKSLIEGEKVSLFSVLVNMYCGIKED